MSTRPIITWFEIPAINLDRAIEFYKKTLRLRIVKTDMMGVTYGLIERPAGTIGGVIVERDKVQGEGTVLFFHTDDISTCLERIIAAGGAVVLPKTILKMKEETGNVIIANSFIDNQTGYVARFRDSEGNVMALHSNS